MEQSENDELTKVVEKKINNHGYGFHQVVMKRADELYSQHKSKWEFSCSEFPVQSHGRDTRIDIVLSKSEQWGTQRSNYLLIAECKRADPALSNWCFIRSQYKWWRASANNSFYYEKLEILNHVKRVVTSSNYEKVGLNNSFQIGVEVKSNEKGNGVGYNKGAIEDAIGQVLLGMNGMVNFFSEKAAELSQYSTVFFIPVVFTTANLWECSADLSETDLGTGNIDLPSESMVKKDWLLFDYHQSPSLKHQAPNPASSDSLEKFLVTQYVRTVAVVNALGINSFLQWAGDLEFK